MAVPVRLRFGTGNVARALILAITRFEDTMNQSHSLGPASVDAPPSGGHLHRIAVVASSWHRDIVAGGVQAIRDELERRRVPLDSVEHFDVPGAFEIPLHAMRLARSGSCDAIIACGLVVNGGIYRHEFVAQAVIDALMRVQLDTDVPVFSAVLTPRDFHEHEAHQRFFREHFVKKGTEVAGACVDTLAGLVELVARVSR